MALNITPGPLVNDGSTIAPNVDLKNLVQQTQITGFGIEQFGSDSEAGFIWAATDPPPLANRSHTTRWFRRGEGVLYRWDMWSESGVSLGAWVACGGRKDYLAWIADGCHMNKGDVLFHAHHRDNVTFNGRPMDYHRYILEVATTSATFRQLPVMPFFVALTEASGGTYMPLVEWGFCAINTDTGATGPGIGCWGQSNFDYRLLQFVNPYTYTNGIIATVAESNAAGAIQLTCFKWPSSSHISRNT
jgi:hypothetical protein